MSRENFVEEEMIGLDDEIIGEDDEFEECEITVPGEEKWAETVWSIPDNCVSIWDMWIELEIADNSKYIINPLAETGGIILRSNNKEIYRIPMLVNLFFSELKGRKVVFTDNSIKIPIDFYALEPMNKIPLYQANNGKIDIVLNIKMGFFINLTFETGNRILKYKSQKHDKNTTNETINYFTTINVDRDTIFSGIGSAFHFYVGLSQPQIIIIDTDTYGTNLQLEKSDLYQIKVILDNQTEPLVFKDVLDEIASFCVMEKKYYAISLDPKLKNIYSIKNWLQSKKSNVFIPTGQSVSKLEICMDYTEAPQLHIIYGVRITRAILD